MMTRLAVSAFLVFVTFACSSHEQASTGGESAVPGQDTGGVSCGCEDDGPAPLSDTADVLIFGDAVDAMDNLGQALEALGHFVIVSPILPEDLQPFDTIWHVGNTEPLTLDEQARLAAFVRGGRGLHLTGERPGGDSMNDSLGVLINELVAGGGIQVGGLGDVLPPGSFFSPYPVNPDALGGIVSTPNAVADIRMLVPGGLAGMAANDNVLVHGVDDMPVGAVWAGNDLACGTGALSIVMDNGWVDLIPYEAHNRLFLENLQSFLNRIPGECSGDDGDDHGDGDMPGDGDADDGVPDNGNGNGNGNGGGGGSCDRDDDGDGESDDCDACPA